MTRSSPPTTRAIANRKLRDQTTGGLVQIVVFEPVVDPNDPDGDWTCRCEVQHATKGVVPVEGKGVDSLQALLSALSDLRRTVQPDAADLAWFHPGQLGLPLILTEDDPDVAALFEHMIEAERCRLAIMAKRDTRRVRLSYSP
jgi:hypothetical protein